VQLGSPRPAARLFVYLLGVFVFFTKRALAIPPAPAKTETNPVTEKKERLSYWDQGEPRPFVASRIEVGLYTKPQIAVGYGKPYWMSATAEVFGITTFSFGAGYAGIRGSLPFLDLRIGTRYSYSYDRAFLQPQDHYEKDDVNSNHGLPNAHYLSLETELAGVLPVLAGYVFPVVTIYNMPSVPDGKFLFDESLRGIMKPPWIMGFRLGYVKTFGKNDFIKAGLLSEFIVLPGRDGSIFRLGPAAQVRITDHMDAQGTLTIVLASPDSLGLGNGSFGVLGVVYRWATGDEHPHFP
jgi:hypothetical protein